MGLILKIISSIFLLLILIAVGTGIYFYKFHVFKTIKICIPEQAQDLIYPCSTDKFCETLFKNNFTEMSIDLETAPIFIQGMIDEVINESIYCNQTCYIKKFYGDYITEDFSGQCNIGDKEITRDLHGKEGLEFVKYLKNKITEE